MLYMEVFSNISSGNAIKLLMQGLKVKLALPEKHITNNQTSRECAKFIQALNETKE